MYLKNQHVFLLIIFIKLFKNCAYNFYNKISIFLICSQHIIK